MISINQTALNAKPSENHAHSLIRLSAASCMLSGFCTSFDYATLIIFFLQEKEISLKIDSVKAKKEKGHMNYFETKVH